MTAWVTRRHTRDTRRGIVKSLWLNAGLGRRRSLPASVLRRGVQRCRLRRRSLLIKTSQVNTSVTDRRLYRTAMARVRRGRLTRTELASLVLWAKPTSGVYTIRRVRLHVRGSSVRFRRVLGLSRLWSRRPGWRHMPRRDMVATVTRMMLRRRVIRRRVARSRRLTMCVCRRILAVWRRLIPRVCLRCLLMQLGRVRNIGLLGLGRAGRHNGPRRSGKHPAPGVLGVGICEVCREPGTGVALANWRRSSTSRVARRRS